MAALATAMEQYLLLCALWPIIMQSGFDGWLTYFTKEALKDATIMKMTIEKQMPFNKKKKCN